MVLLVHHRKTLIHLGRVIQQQEGRNLDTAQEHVEVLDWRLRSIAGRDTIIADDLDPVAETSEILFEMGMLPDKLEDFEILDG